MKTSKIATGWVLITSLFLLSNCSSMGSGTSGKEISASGPTVLNERVRPDTIELNNQLQPTQTPEILADVKDFNSNISQVTLKFLHVPLEVPMKNIGGTTWSATLNPKQLQELAISGETITYDANITAKNASGQTAMSKKPLVLVIKTAEVSKTPT